MYIVNSIQTLAILTMYGSLGKEYLIERVYEWNIEEWLKCGVTTKRRILRI